MIFFYFRGNCLRCGVSTLKVHEFGKLSGIVCFRLFCCKECKDVFEKANGVYKGKWDVKSGWN